MSHEEAVATVGGHIKVGEFIYVRQRYHWDLVVGGRKLAEVSRFPPQPNKFSCEIQTIGQREQFEHVFTDMSDKGEHDVFPQDELDFWEMATAIITQKILLVKERLCFSVFDDYFIKLPKAA